MRTRPNEGELELRTHPRSRQFVTLLAIVLADLRVLDPPWNLAIRNNQKCTLKLSNGDYDPSLSATVHFANKNAAICALLLLFPSAPFI
jgi:hypothetical protein